ncbi:MAG: glycosyltransferase family 4 protein [Nitrospira sp.]|nr:glycosyltransferase family 4 protein [Nitrospira sp.]
MRIAYVALIEIDVANACLIHTREIGEQWARLGHEVTVLLPKPLRKQAWSGVRHAWVRWWGFDWPRQLAFIGESAWRLIRLHRARPFDLLYVRELTVRPGLAWLLRRMRLPYFVEVNGWVLDEMRMMGASARALRVARRTQGRILSGASGIVASTTGNADKVIREYGIPTERVMVQELGTNAEHFLPGDRRRARLALALPQEGPVILFAGSFHPHHDLSTMVKAFASLGEAEQRPWLLLVGYGTTWDAVRKQCESLGIADRVLLPGSRPYEAMPLYFQAADIAVLPLTGANIRQRNGCITLKLWDYMAAGLPVLVTDFQDTPSAAILMGKVYSVKPEDPDAMAAGLRDLLRQENLRRRLGQTGLDYVRKHRTWRQAAEDTLRFIEDRLATTRSHRP